MENSLKRSFVKKIVNNSENNAFVKLNNERFNCAKYACERKCPKIRLIYINI
jgi:hypothetical protein